MVKIAPARADSFIDKPDSAVCAFLLFGPDRGLVRERMERLTCQVVEDPADPFRVVNLTGAELAEDPARLADEAAAIAFGGGQRVVRVLEAGDAVAKPLGAYLEAPAGDARILIAAENLSPRSPLRRLAESADNAAAIGCYTDEGRSLQSVIEESLAGAGLRADRGALVYLERALGGDRLATRREMEKLVLYAEALGKREIAADDAAACIGDSAALSLDDLTMAAGGGDARSVARLTDRLLAEGTSPVAILRAAARHFDRLHWLAGRAQAGEPAAKAIESLRPRVFFKHKKPLAAQAGFWREPALRRVLAQLLEAERQCKQTGYPDETVCARTLLSIAAQAARFRA